MAIISGFPFPHVNLYQELVGIHIYGGKIPKCVEDKIQSLSTKQILGGKINRTIPDKIF